MLHSHTKRSRPTRRKAPILAASISLRWMGRSVKRGRVRTAVSRVGLTVQQTMGLSVDRWGTDSNNTNKSITEIMA